MSPLRLLFSCQDLGAGSSGGREHGHLSHSGQPGGRTGGTYRLQSRHELLPRDPLVLTPVHLAEYLQDLDLAAAQVRVQGGQGRRLGQSELGHSSAGRPGALLRKVREWGRGGEFRGDRLLECDSQS